MPPFETSPGVEGMPQPEGARGRRSPNDFAARAVEAVRGLLGGTGLGAGGLEQLRGQPGGTLERFVSWLRGRNGARGGRPGGPEQASQAPMVRRDMMAPEEATARLNALQQKFPGMQALQFPMNNPQQMLVWTQRWGINPGDIAGWIEKVERTADRMLAELPQVPGWQSPEWTSHVAFDGNHFLAFNGRDTCVATGGQLLFARGVNPAQIGSQIRPQANMQMVTKDGAAVQWELTEKGERFTTDGGQLKTYHRYNDGTTREVMSGGVTQSVTHFGDTIVARVNGQGAGVTQSPLIENRGLSNALPQGTFVRTADGTWLGNSAREIQRRGMDGYLRTLASLPLRELAAYVSSIFNDQHEDVYRVRNETQAVRFFRDRLNWDQSIRQGKGDCREMAKLMEKVLRIKGVRCMTIKAGSDHAALAWIEPSGNAERPYACRTMESSGIHDDHAYGATPGQALRNAWDPGERPDGMATILNDQLRGAEVPWEQAGRMVLNASAPA